MPKAESGFTIKSVLQVTIDLDTAIWLRDLARNRETTIPTVVRQILAAAKQKEEKR